MSFSCIPGIRPGMKPSSPMRSPPSAAIRPSSSSRACRALTEQDANYFQRLAQILARYHKTTAPLKSIRIESGRVCAMDSGGRLVIPLSCDYAIWSENAAGRVEDFGKLSQEGSEIKGLVLWVDGKVSDRATQELKNRKIDLATGVLDGK